MQNNSLRKITREHFASLTSLTELYLQNNRITEIETQAFSGLAQLQYLVQYSQTFDDDKNDLFGALNFTGK